MKMVVEVASGRDQTVAVMESESKNGRAKTAAGLAYISTVVIPILVWLGIGPLDFFDIGKPPPTPAPSAPTPAPGRSGGPESTIRHQGSLTLTEDLWGVNGAGADLDAPAADPQWGVVNLPSTAREDIKWWGSPRVEVPGAEGITFEGSAKGSLETGRADCRSSSDYSDARIYFARLKPGQTICVSTSEKRISAMVTKSVSDADPFEIGFDITTFNNSGD
jgi:hypothetical protein